jgi:hypothetical protein
VPNSIIPTMRWKSAWSFFNAGSGRLSKGVVIDAEEVTHQWCETTPMVPNQSNDPLWFVAFACNTKAVIFPQIPRSCPF